MNASEAIQRLDNALETANAAIQQAVESGLTVELIRASRCHNGRGQWGDQIILKIPPH